MNWKDDENWKMNLRGDKTENKLQRKRNGDEIKINWRESENWNWSKEVTKLTMNSSGDEIENEFKRLRNLKTDSRGNYKLI